MVLFTYVNAKQPYFENEEHIKIYWATKIKAKHDYKAFKDKQKIEQKRIRDELLDNEYVNKNVFDETWYLVGRTAKFLTLYEREGFYFTSSNDLIAFF